jgi:hypothetical protein
MKAKDLKKNNTIELIERFCPDLYFLSIKTILRVRVRVSQPNHDSDFGLA